MMKDKYNISEKDISWIINDEKIPEAVKENFLFVYEKNKLNSLINNIEPQLLSAINEALKYIINDRDRIDDMLRYVYERYEKS